MTEDHDPRAVHLDLAHDRLRSIEGIYNDEFEDGAPRWLTATRQLVEEYLKEEMDG